MTATEKQKQAEAEAKAMLESLSPAELEELKDSFKTAFLSVVKTQKDKLDTMVKLRDEKEAERKEVREKGRTAVYPESSELFEKQMELGQEVAALDSKIMNQENIIQAVENKGGYLDLTDEKGMVHRNIADFREVDTNQIEFKLDSILTDKPPVYIPKIDEELFARRGYVFDAIRITNDSYIVSVTKHKEDAPNYYVILTLDQLVLAQDYYFAKAKAKNQKQAEDKTAYAEKKWDDMSDSVKERYLMQTNAYHGLPAKIKKTISKEDYSDLSWQEREKIYKFYKRYGAKRLKSKLGENSMWVSFHKMYERFKDPSAVQPKQGFAHQDAFNYWAAFREMMKYKMLDIKIQRQDLSENYKTALETSFGESNTSTELKDEFGILVKRQSGEKIKPMEVDQIRDAIVSVQKIFGNLKPNFEKFNMKFSHTGTRYVFASKALGVYISQMGTIAVSDKFGDNEFKMTTAHEIGHFIDNKIGELNGKRWATDDYEGIAGQIAFTFRDNMNKPKSAQTEYINATKECFARALEQFYGIETFGDEAGVTWSYSPMDKFRPFFVADDFVNKDAYYEKLRPLIIEFFQENKDILEYTYDIDESNDPTPIGNEEELERKAAIESLEALLEVSGGKNEKEIKEAIEAIKTLQNIKATNLYLEVGGSIPIINRPALSGMKKRNRAKIDAEKELKEKGFVYGHLTDAYQRMNMADWQKSDEVFENFELYTKKEGKDHTRRAVKTKNDDFYYLTTSKYENGGETNKNKNRIFTQLIKKQVEDVITGKSQNSKKSTIETARVYLRRNVGEPKEGGKQVDFKKQEEKALKEFSKENKLLINNSDFIRYISEGSEQKVFCYSPTTLLKLNNSIFYESWDDYLLSLQLHNLIFPDTRYELLGFTTDENGEFNALVTQPYIASNQRTDLNQVKQILLENGFDNVRRNDYVHEDLGIILEDLHDENVLNKDGVLYFIDTVFYVDKNKFSKGGETDSIYKEWKELVNMSPKELYRFYNSEEGKEAGLSDEEADNLGISNGRESARWILKMKKTPFKEWTPKMHEWAKKQISFIKRMKGNKGELFDKKGNKTRKHTSLLIWGHNPNKQ